MAYNSLNPAPYRNMFAQPGYMSFQKAQNFQRLAQYMYMKSKVPYFRQTPTANPVPQQIPQSMREEEQYAKPLKKVKVEPNDDTPYIHFKKEEDDINVKVLDETSDSANSFNIKHEDTGSCDSGPCCVSNDSTMTAIHGSDSLNSLDMKSLSEADIKAATLEITQERADYAALFDEMQENLMTSMKKQLEFLNMMKEMNKPKYSTLCPVLDKINPLVAGVMMKKSKIHEKTLEVMRRSNNLLKNGPVQHNFQQRKKNNGEADSINNKRAFEEIDATFKSESSRKAAKSAKTKEKEASIKQIMKFILEDVAESQEEIHGLKIHEESMI